jgi:hypothetical protein
MRGEFPHVSPLNRRITRSFSQVDGCENQSVELADSGRKRLYALSH